MTRHAEQAPAYQRIASELTRRITDGELPAGSILPSEAELKAEFGVARETVRQALKLLEDQGLIEVHPGRGRFVRGEARRQPSSRYELIAAELRDLIIRGELAAGAMLPSEHELMRRHGTSRNTVRRALALLVAEGLVQPRRGAGTIVVDRGQNRPRD